PATILSRSRYLRFGFPEAAAVEEFYSKSAGEKPSALLRKLCGPRLGLAARALADPVFAEALRAASEELKKVLAADMRERLEFAAVAKDMERGELNDLLFRWLVFLDNDLFTASRSPAVAVFAHRAEKIASALRDIDSNLNKKLVFDNLLISL
ncbi:MAG: hypothetical protein M1275_01880, partial [Patescibacteria group bacterium]|nr:hypothetical protein [Patescibacteria group bacterium]